jgi:Glycosyl hydrolase catalytic core
LILLLLRSPLALAVLVLMGCSGQASSGLADSGADEDAGVADAGADAGTTGGSKSAKRGIAYDFASAADLAAVSGGVSWWYNWGSKPNAAVPADSAGRYALDYYPMLWNGSFDGAAVKAFLSAHPAIQYLLVMNEPNLTGQANLTPEQAAAIWPSYEAVATEANVKLVGPQITWGTMAGYEDPVQWLDAFLAAYRAANSGREPRVDVLGFHWYDYGLAGQLDTLKNRYGKPFWVTEFANWHAQQDGAQIDSLAKQKAQMTDLVKTCEERADVLRYAWFTGRVSPDPHFDSLLGADGQLTELGALYVSLPH